MEEYYHLHALGVVFISQVGMFLGWRKVDRNKTCANITLLTGQLISGIVSPITLCYVTLLTHSNPDLIISGSNKILYMIFKAFKAEVEIVRIVFVTRA